MRTQLQRRLDALKKEFTAGRARSAEIEQQQATLHQTLLRISGAIQVLEEELKAVSHADAHSNGTPLENASQGGAEPRVNSFLDHAAQ